MPVFKADSFADFRDIALLEYQQEFSYRHSFGKTSKFFLALADKQLLATQCPVCSSIFMPPRAVCPKDLNPTKWLELSGSGTLESWTLCPFPVSYAKTESPYILAYIRLEGTQSLFLHQLRNINSADLSFGLNIKVVFGESMQKHPLDQFWFEPV